MFFGQVSTPADQPIREKQTAVGFLMILIFNWKKRANKPKHIFLLAYCYSLCFMLFILFIACVILFIAKLNSLLSF